LSAGKTGCTFNVCTGGGLVMTLLFAKKTKIAKLLFAVFGKWSTLPRSAGKDLSGMAHQG
jgi:hypothetical protein